VDGRGEWVAFDTTDGGLAHLAAIRLGSGTPPVVVETVYEAFHPFFSPSNRWIYFQRNHKNIYRVPGPAQDWRKQAPEKVTDFTGPDLYIDGPKTSADGSRLFYARGRTTGGIVIVQRARAAGRPAS
jgi:hypothetical protein